MEPFFGFCVCTAKTKTSTSRKMHSGMKTYGCELCGKSFLDSLRLRMHLLSHSELRVPVPRGFLEKLCFLKRIGHNKISRPRSV
ncbi:Zinc finger and BTB domain-containing protein 16-A [Liparis tanakae]|uniref:Zinc finger and BTB domain-containing protein 16-A n=1 Tax=Liparis tanakae TaxID=230148 RepID=A0A4Z2IPS7_9TELE|nr:Zinc finger and BTB domain-containing protein 16-A [Liparis tanakae]